jgi:hypothetical protein
MHSTFIDNDSTVAFYYRPHDQRARMLFSSVDSRGRENIHSVPLTSLTVIRDHSILTLCRASSRDGALKRWANLKFIHYERLVLFYSTFIALKRQDLNETPELLIDNPAEKQGETEHYGGVIRDNHKLHALRLFECPGSGAFRLEARPYRGGRDEVPIWTAFLTKYLQQCDPIFSLEADKVTVTMIRLRPAPFVFVSEYRLPQTQDGDYVLRFDNRDGEFNLFYVRRLMEGKADDASSRCQGPYHNVDHSVQQARIETGLIEQLLRFFLSCLSAFSKKHSVAFGWFDYSEYTSAISLGRL